MVKKISSENINSLNEEDDPPSTLVFKKELDSFLITKNIEIVSEFKRCYALWKEFSSQKTLFDTWEFRLAFYRAYRYKPYFLL